MEGIFITFEGPDGSGKTTQLKLLADFLSQKGYDVKTTRDPGGTKISNKIRGILLNPEYQELKDQTEILLYAASRAQLVHEEIIPALKQGKIVLCDRYIDASIAYQSFGLEIDRSIVEQINQFASLGLKPNRTYLLEVSPEVGKKRLNKRNINEFGEGLDRIEQKDIEYYKRVLNGFRKLADEEPKRISKINADQAIEKIFNQIKNDFESFIKI